MKYALVDNGRIKVGPRDYHQQFFYRYLMEIGVDFTLPETYAEATPIEISSTISIVPVIEPAIPNHHPITQQPAGPFWNITPTLITGTYDIVPVELEAARNFLRDRLAAYRYDKEVGSIKLTVQGQEVEISTARGYDREIWHQMLTLTDDTTSISFKFTQPTLLWLDITKADVQAIVAAMAAHVQTWFRWEGERTAAIATADYDQLEAIYQELI